jgi:hypothetical protein
MKPERIPGGWQVGDTVFRGRLARAKAYKFAATYEPPKKKRKKKSTAKKKADG